MSEPTRDDTAAGGMLFYVPDRPAIDAAALAEVGLAELLGDGWAQGSVDRGPDDHAGVLLRSSQGPRIPLRCGDLQWRPAGPIEQARYWIGFDPQRPPGPESLRRLQPLAGVAVTLGDGREWTVPIARLIDGATLLPLIYGLDERGQTVGRIAERHESLWDLAGEVFGIFRRIVNAKVEGAEYDDFEALPGERRLEIAAAALGANYRLGRWECLALGLLGSREIQRCLEVLIDWDGLLELTSEAAARQKKSAPPADAG